MELALAILVAGPVGYLTLTRKRGLMIYLILWAIVFPIQTVVVFSSSDGGGDVLYWVFNAVILAAGIGFNRLGSVLGERRRASRALADRAVRHAVDG
jgi:hypothetical protein